MNPDERPSPLRNTFQADVAALLADARLLRTYAVERGKLPDDGFHGEFVQTCNQLAEYATGPQAPDPATLAALEKKFLVLYNKLAAAVAPVTAESIRRSQAARERRFFWPTVLTVSASILVFFAVVVLQGYWVMGKRLRDLIQRQDMARQELVIKTFTMEDTIAQLQDRLDAGTDCDEPPVGPQVTRKQEAPNVDQIRKCAVRDALKEERFKTVYAKRPVVRETNSLQAQVEPAIAVLSGTRLAQLPRAATAAEAGHALDVRSWNAFFAPRGTPQPVLAKLTGALQQAVADPALRKQMEGLGVELPAPADATPAAVTALIARGIRDDMPALKAKGQYLD